MKKRRVPTLTEWFGRPEPSVRYWARLTDQWWQHCWWVVLLVIVLLLWRS